MSQLLHLIIPNMSLSHMQRYELNIYTFSFGGVPCFYRCRHHLSYVLVFFYLYYFESSVNSSIVYSSSSFFFCSLLPRALSFFVRDTCVAPFMFGLVTHLPHIVLSFVSYCFSPFHFSYYLVFNFVLCSLLFYR